VTAVHELNKGYNIGTKQETLTINENYERSSSYDGYYQKAKSRANLKVVTLARVQKILLSGKGDDLTATGVVFSDQGSGSTVSVKATKEVILSAGTFQTPQILMLSVSGFLSGLLG
jgi:choline dehydrogenase